ncbi:MAG: hypothetical protein HW386_2427 [Gammaproteobacteria bacterium]|nr:hypothetical protein [Gammaproteobacteria bacterium]
MNISRRNWQTCCWWIIILGVALSLKQYYSIATARDLQWLLRPLAWLTQSLLGLPFINNGSGEWLNTENNIAIIKSCAGLNFLILSLFVYAKRYQILVASSRGTGGLLLLVGRYIAICLLAAWCATLVVNAIRIVVAIAFYQYDLTIVGLTPEQMHRIAGVLIYFPALWLQFHLFARMKHVPAGVTAALFYLGLLIFVPLVTGYFQEQPRLFIEHIFVTGGLTIALLVVHSGILRIWNKYCTRVEKWADNNRRKRLLISRIRKRL